jgi:hypothetical protein
MLDTGFPQADVENDFARARRHQVIASLAHRLRRGRGDSNGLVPLEDVTGALGWRGQRQLGLQTIPVDTIIGTVDSRHEFDRRFRPTTNRVRPRWEQLALAQRRGAAIPPIEVYRVGGLHFVSDGHHRVSIAAATGQQVIDAYVTEVLTAGPATAQDIPGFRPRHGRRGRTNPARRDRRTGGDSASTAPDRAAATEARHPASGRHTALAGRSQPGASSQSP